MRYQVLYTLKAKEDLVGIDKKEVVKILEKINFFVVGVNPLKYAKKLVNFGGGTYRFRIGNYRVIFDLDNRGNISILLVLKIGHRKEVYT